MEAPFAFANSLWVEPTDRGSRVTFTGATDGMPGFFGKLADPLVSRMFARDMRRNLRTLKAILEAASMRVGGGLKGALRLVRTIRPIEPARRTWRDVEADKDGPDRAGRR